jgi:hypothetical protein
MPSSFDRLSARDFSHTDFAGKDGHAAHSTAHASGLPLMADEIACWPDGVDVISDRYAKRIMTASRSGLRGTVWTPLFNRRRFLATEPLIPSTYFSCEHMATHCMTEQHRWSVIHLNDLISADHDPFLHSLGVPVSARNPYLKWRNDGTTYFIDTVSLLELVVAQDEPLFRLLMSPFKDGTVQVKTSGEEVVILCTNDTAFTSRGGANRKSIWDSFETVACIAYWLAASDRRLELLECADSLRRGAAPHIPCVQSSIMAGVRGYERDSNFLVRSIQPLESTPLWPCEWKVMTILNRRENRGRVMTVPPFQRRPEGTVRQGCASFQKLGSAEVSSMIRLFKGSTA